MKPFNLQHIEDLEFYTNEDVDYTTLDSKEVSMNMSNELKVSKSLADMFMTIEYKYKETNALLLKQKVKFTFYGDFTDCQPNGEDKNNEEWKNNLKKISLEFMIVTLGTMRGMIYVKVRNNSFLSQQLIPVIPKEFLKMGINDSVNKSILKENHQG